MSMRKADVRYIITQIRGIATNLAKNRDSRHVSIAQTALEDAYLRLEEHHATMLPDTDDYTEGSVMAPESHTEYPSEGMYKYGV